MTEISEAAKARWVELVHAANCDPFLAAHRLVQEVSDTAKAAVSLTSEPRMALCDRLAPFILPEPVDPLVEALRASVADPEQFAAKLRDNLAKRGLKIVKAEQ